MNELGNIFLARRNSPATASAPPPRTPPPPHHHHPAYAPEQRLMIATEMQRKVQGANSPFLRRASRSSLFCHSTLLCIILTHSSPLKGRGGIILCPPTRDAGAGGQGICSSCPPPRRTPLHHSGFKHCLFSIMILHCFYKYKKKKNVYPVYCLCHNNH